MSNYIIIFVNNKNYFIYQQPLVYKIVSKLIDKIWLIILVFKLI